MRKLQFGTGPNALEGWENYQEHEVNLCKPLPFADNSIDFIFGEHLWEHLTPKDGWNALDESLRILKPGGVVRIIVPSVDQIWMTLKGRILAEDSAFWPESANDYRAFMTERAPEWFPAAGLPAPQLPISDKDIVKAIIFCHGHQSCWTQELLASFMGAVGFEVAHPPYGTSTHAELIGVDSHWKLLGLNRCVLESVVCEGTK